MLSAVWLVAAVVLAILLTFWVTFTLTRLDRLHARVDAAQAALDAQLVRRAAALLHVADNAGVGLADSERRHCRVVADHALASENSLATRDGDRQSAENEVGRSVRELAGSDLDLDPSAVAELREAGVRVIIARRFYNDAVRDTRALRARRMPRVLHLAGRRELPQFFDIDDTVVVPAESPPPGATDGRGAPQVAAQPAKDSA